MNEELKWEKTVGIIIAIAVAAFAIVALISGCVSQPVSTSLNGVVSIRYTSGYGAANDPATHWTTIVYEDGTVESRAGTSEISTDDIEILAKWVSDGASGDSKYYSRGKMSTENIRKITSASTAQKSGSINDQVTDVCWAFYVIRNDKVINASSTAGEEVLYNAYDSIEWEK